MYTILSCLSCQFSRSLSQVGSKHITEILSLLKSGTFIDTFTEPVSLSGVIVIPEFSADTPIAPILNIKHIASITESIFDKFLVILITPF